MALDDVSLDIAQGELVCLLGPSGCGKTTLLRCIAGLERQDRGVICIVNWAAGAGASAAGLAARGAHWLELRALRRLCRLARG